VTEKLHEWNPLSEDVLNNHIAAYDRVRSRCPIAHSEQLHSVAIPTRACNARSPQSERFCHRQVL
jgi:hypothetical protein